MRVSMFEKLRSSSTGGSEPSAPNSASTMVNMKSRSKPTISWLSQDGAWKMPATAMPSYISSTSPMRPLSTLESE